MPAMLSPLKEGLPHFPAEKSEPMAQVVLVAIMEVAVKILLLGLCLIFLR